MNAHARLGGAFGLLTALLIASALALCAGAIRPACAYAQDAQLSLAPAQEERSTVVKVKLSKTKATIRNNGTVALKATLVPSDKRLPLDDRSITWSVSNKKIARITQNGIVQGKRTGTVRVTARAANGKAATAKVRVVVDKAKIARKIPVLTYHRITTDAAKNRFYAHTNLAIGASAFEREMIWLKRHGYTTVSTQEFADWRLEGAFLPKKSVLITIDDGFYEAYHVAYPILRRYNLKATSFIIGSHAKAKTRAFDASDSKSRFIGRDVISRIRASYPNWEFQSHTYAMHKRGADGNGLATHWGRARIDADFAKNAQFGFTCIAYPYGHTSKALLASVKANKSMRLGFGYLMDHPATRKSPRYNIPRFKVIEDGTLKEFKRILKTVA